MFFIVILANFSFEAYVILSINTFSRTYQGSVENDENEEVISALFSHILQIMTTNIHRLYPIEQELLVGCCSSIYIRSAMVYKMSRFPIK